MSKLSMKWRTLLPVIITLIVSIVLFGSYVAFVLADNLIDLAHEEIKDTAQRYANQVTITTNSVLSTIESMAKLASTQIAAENASRDSWQQSLIDLIENSPNIDAAYLYFAPDTFDGQTDFFAPHISMLNGSAQIKALNTNDVNVSEFLQMAQNQKSFVSNPQFIDGLISSTVVSPVFVHNRNIGFVAAEFSFIEIEQQLSDEGMVAFPGGYSSVISPDGMFVAHKDPFKTGQSAFEINDPTITALLKRAQASNSTVEEDGYSAILQDESRYVIQPIRIPGVTNVPWLAMLVVPYSDIHAPILKVISTIITVVAITLLISSSVLIYVIHISSNRITLVNERLFNATRQVLAAAVQIAGSSENLAQGGVQQAAGIEETSAIMSQTASMIQETTASTEQASSLANKASSAAVDGLERVENLAVTMRELEKSSDEISKVIKIINNIAFKINILALNAAVEAARAGDSGRGFAMVAEEVRTLAHRSAEAADDTAAIIERNLQLSQRGVSNSIEVSKALHDINAHNIEVSNLVAQISDASHGQAKGIDQINIALSQMEDVTQSNAAVSEENSAAASGLEAQVNDLNVIAAKLSAVVHGVSHQQQETARS